MAALAMLKGSTFSLKARLHFCFGVKGTKAAVGSLTVWKSGMTPMMRSAWSGVRADAGLTGISEMAGAGRRVARGSSSESPGSGDCVAEAADRETAKTNRPRK
jgi:hypothetical protein